MSVVLACDLGGTSFRAALIDESGVTRAQAMILGPTAIDRMGLYGEDKPLGIHEGITRRQSLRMHTRGTAYQLHQENKTGTIEAGKFADLVMLDRDVTTCPVSEIKDSVPQLTMVGGNVTFDLTTTAGKTARRALEAAASTTAATGRIKHDQLGGRHTGCPCTSAHK